jgi:phosphatidylserine/phosphatidylglycerophosphate/cardiolipin synthase-like enzyme
LIGVTTLTDGGQSPAAVAREVADFVNEARQSLDLALYDVRIETGSASLVLAALLAAHQRGVAVRLLYNVDHPGPIPVPPPPETVPDALEALPLPTRGVPGVPDLMHHKYAVRDGQVVWTGSTNWTDDSWTRQENVIVRVVAPPLAHAYVLDFEHLWAGGKVEAAGKVEPRPVNVEGASVRPWFCPG